MRLFIAFKAPEAVKRAIEQLQARLVEEAGDKVRLVNSGIQHVTMAFLGEVSERDLALLINIIQHHVGGLAAFKVEAGEIEVFPNTVAPRVIVQAVKVESNIAEVRNRLCEELKLRGLMEDAKPWRPHLTLGRVGEGRNLKGFDPRSLESERQVWNVGEIGLYQSTLSQEGAEHVLLEIFSLK